MNAPHLIDYDVKAIEIEDTEIDPSQWNLSSALDSKITYRLLS